MSFHQTGMSIRDTKNRKVTKMELLAQMGYELLDTDHPEILAIDKNEFQIEEPIA